MDNKEWNDLFLHELREIKNDVKEIKSEMATLKVKVAMIASAIGGVVGSAWKTIINFL